MRTPIEIIEQEIERLEANNKHYAAELLNTRTSKDRAKDVFEAIQNNHYAAYILGEVRRDIERER